MQLDPKPLLVSPDLEELSRTFCRGMAFLRDNVFVVHRVIQIFNDRLRDLDSNIRLSLSPPFVPRGSGDSRPPSPRLLTVKDGIFTLAKVDLSVHEQMVIVSEERIVSTPHDDAVMKLAQALVSAVTKSVKES